MGHADPGCAMANVRGLKGWFLSLVEFDEGGLGKVMESAGPGMWI